MTLFLLSFTPEQTGLLKIDCHLFNRSLVLSKPRDTLHPAAPGLHRMPLCVKWEGSVGPRFRGRCSRGLLKASRGVEARPGSYVRPQL